VLRKRWLLIHRRARALPNIPQLFTFDHRNPRTLECVGPSKMRSQVRSEIRSFLEREAKRSLEYESPLCTPSSRNISAAPRQGNRNSRLSVILITEGADGRKKSTLVWRSRFARSGDVANVCSRTQQPRFSKIPRNQKGGENHAVFPSRWCPPR